MVHNYFWLQTGELTLRDYPVTGEFSNGLIHIKINKKDHK